MNTPTDTDQWTSKSVFTLYGHPNNPDGWQAVANAHNASIAAERLKVAMNEGIEGELREANQRYYNAEIQVRTLVDALNELRAEIEKSRPMAAKLEMPNFGLREIGFIDATLAKVGK